MSAGNWIERNAPNHHPIRDQQTIVRLNREAAQAKGRASVAAWMKGEQLKGFM
jgi:hypothetical protein